MRFPVKITSSCIWVAIPVDWVILHWYACDADGRSGCRCTVTWLPNFLGWVVYHIFLPMVLRFARESSANIYNARNCGKSIVIKIFLLYFRYFGETFFFSFLCSPFSSYRVLKRRAEYWSRIPAPFSRKSRIPHFLSRFHESFFFLQNTYLKKDRLLQKPINVGCRLIFRLIS